MVSHPELGSDPPIGSDRESGRDIPRHRYKNTRLNDVKTCQNRAAGTTCTGTALTCTGIGYSLLGCTGTGCPLPIFAPYVPVQLNLYRYKCSFSARECSGFCIFTHFLSTNLLQYFPYKKSTMESLQKYSKSGLESMKIYFPHVRTFLPKSKSKYEVRVLIFLTLNLFKSLLVCCLAS